LFPNHQRAIRVQGFPETILWHGDNIVQDLPEAEIVQPLEFAIPEGENVRIYTMPTVKNAACLVHHGRFDDQAMTDAFRGLHEWIEQHGYQSQGATRQVFLANDSSDPDRFMIELQIPVIKI
jgi:effector-binding domain-containing protein